jgi:predicted nucleotidyltransferase
MTEEKLLNEFVERMRTAAGPNLLSVFLYGSAADGEFHPEYSDLNLLCIVSNTSLASLAKIAPVADWWRGKKHHPPLVLTSQELKTSADVFSIEFLDMKQRYRVLFGEDVLRGLDVPMQLHRRQLEYELREKLFLLRQHVLLAGTDDKKLWEVMLRSLSSFTTLFRHVLVELGEQGRKHSRDAVVELSKRLNFSDSAFLQLLDVRAKKAGREQLSATDVASRYLHTIEQVVAAVDTMRSPGT